MPEQQDAHIALWFTIEERAAIFEHDGGLPRGEAGRLAWEIVRATMQRSQ
jgi:hypothetical protein